MIIKCLNNNDFNNDYYEIMSGDVVPSSQGNTQNPKERGPKEGTTLQSILF